jgi:hypothetical protein
VSRPCVIIAREKLFGCATTTTTTTANATTDRELDRDNRDRYHDDVDVKRQR